MIQAQEARRPLSVSELAQQVRVQLRPLSAVLVKGEVSGLKRTANGHFSFSIRDGAAVVQAFLWQKTAARLPLIPEDGQEFVFRGKVDFWPTGGLLRLEVDYVEFDDVGKLRGQIERLKQRLEAEGAFEASRKRRLPFLPRRVALVTSPTGAVIHDLQETIWERFPNMDIAVYPAQVQGAASPGSIAGALAACNRAPDVSVIIIARGGGSFEELYAFNNEPVARAILSSRVPVVTALGHTSDRTVADLVADAECRTPTEAASRVVPKKAELQEQLSQRQRRLDRELEVRLRGEAERLGARRQRLQAALNQAVERPRERLRRLRAEVQRLSPGQQVERRREALRERRQRLERLGTNVWRGRQADLARRPPARVEELARRKLTLLGGSLEQRSRRLAALSPEAVLERGYSITQDAATGVVIRAAAEASPGTQVRVRVARGRLTASVDTVEP